MSNSCIRWIFPLEGQQCRNGKGGAGAYVPEIPFPNLSAAGRQNGKARMGFLVSSSSAESASALSHHKTALLFQAAVSAMVAGKRIIFITTAKLKELPKPVHLMRSFAEDESGCLDALSFLRFVYPNTQKELFHYLVALGSVESPEDLPDFVIVDDVETYLRTEDTEGSKKSFAEKEVAKCRLFALLRDLSETICRRKTEQSASHGDFNLLAGIALDTSVEYAQLRKMHIWADEIWTIVKIETEHKNRDVLQLSCVTSVQDIKMNFTYSKHKYFAVSLMQET